ncbi:hypothetical protein COV53_04365 [Candidatus Gottesmanbacteria bacterium CG11_big_fil_rev_8_21_14_0_20_37_11]|uniref:HPr kinase/phosphorylase C-terminal domain-containing protein n=3 Tax=Candidatus Gottesmaniibacteriota TaxID=1752720 RepID=A0A2M7RSV5_9BACT|nr:MAG: hypothetical protein AUJ73_04495 [Candidatus Gottesmanbacteria bacterium CG1_02_37_22]PIP32710.1 MAG: hypothetical protein COX23_03480 [Candidatus Gottesmanbacteria bacterium CG23_combo_of_CG06-09_8_20_14_all_37_19]PIR08171.1 MAG: hypothetical protein COV53_04365 [Candidatus Gottesmanbacteria bacterium CG11_big_fil_rev_8_21_14_0_20_37_11]PIZ03119.1 MAG: hypothetical protein COY59_01265 [Candidatus Gottesmanbacteria bacterium CG_4_10_14_0_8_um_filter_37_24]
MSLINLKIADFIISIKFSPTINENIPIEGIFNTLEQDIKYHFRDFITKEKVKKIDYTIEAFPFSPYLTHRKNRVFLFFFEENPTKIVTYQNISIHEMVIIVRYALLKLLSLNKGMFFHASASLVNNKAVLFLGSSGSGKSTIVTLLKNKHEIIADDTLILREDKSGLYFYQSPFYEKGLGVKSPRNKFLVNNIIFIKKSKQSNIKQITNKEKIIINLTHQLCLEKVFLNMLLQNLFLVVKKYNFFYYLEFPKNRAELLKLIRKSNS